MQGGEIRQHLQGHGIRASHQRILIYAYLLRHRIHPTVDTIFGEMSRTLPSLSRTTVYNTLKAFVDHGIVSTITIEENESRYDIDTSDHGHFKCTNCGRLYDFGVSSVDLHAEGLDGFRITQRHIYYRGNCDKCQESGSEDGGSGSAG